jgi:hypothetical protein
MASEGLRRITPSMPCRGTPFGALDVQLDQVDRRRIVAEVVIKRDRLNVDCPSRVLVRLDPMIAGVGVAEVQLGRSGAIRESGLDDCDV